MARPNRGAPSSPEKLRELSDYYRLNTKAVDDLVSADSENSPQVSPEELSKYRSKSGIHLPRWLKAVLLKAWFAGAVCFFIFWGLGLYLSGLDMMLVFGISLGMVTDLLVNSIFRFSAVTEGENDGFMMFPKRSVLHFFLNILYGLLLLLCVVCLYQLINSVCIALGAAEDSVPLGVEPLLFGLFYMGFDMLLLGCKHLLRRIAADARSAAGEKGA